MSVNDTARWRLTLYVSGASPHSTSALETVRRICDDELRGRVELQVVDILDAGAQAVADGVVVVPTLVKRMPAPRRKIAGDLSDSRRVRDALDIRPAAGHDTEREIEDLSATLNAIRTGGVDAVITSGARGDELYMLNSAAFVP